MKNILLLIACLCLWNSIYSQRPYFLDNSENPMQFNPAATGIEYNNRVALSSQILFLGIDGSPITHQLNYEKDIDSTRFGLGVLVSYDQIGFQKEQFYEGHIRFSIIDKEVFKLSIGTALIYSNYHLTPEWNSISDGIKNDPLIPDEFRYQSASIGSGIWLKTNRLRAGVSYYSQIKEWNDQYYYRSNIFYSFLSIEAIRTENFILQPEIFYFDNNSNLLNYGANIYLYENYRIGLLSNNYGSIIPSFGVNYRKFSFDLNTRILYDSIILRWQDWLSLGIQIAYNIN